MAIIQTSLEALGALYTLASIVVNLPWFARYRWAAVGRRLVLQVKPSVEQLAAAKKPL